jgi:hypothetical protein
MKTNTPTADAIAAEIKKQLESTPSASAKEATLMFRACDLGVQVAMIEQLERIANALEAGNAP